jgi:4-amino-4-deoxy-L-arabinose transferase-like glycosyltransferase
MSQQVVQHPREMGRGGPRRRTLGVILAASFALKLILLVPAHQTYPVRDALSYHQAARDLYANGRYETIRPPLYPAMLAAAIWLASFRGPDALTRRRHRPDPPSDLDIARFMQVVLSTVTVWLVFMLGRELFDRRAGLVAAGIFAFYPAFVGFSHLLWAETLFVFLNVGWMLLLVRGVRTGRAALLLAGGALLGLASLARQVVSSFLPLAGAWMFLMRPTPRRGTARLAAAMVLGTVLVIGPWTIRNAARYRTFVAIAPNSGLALLWGASDDIFGVLRSAGVDWRSDVVDLDRRAGARAWEIIRNDPWGYLRRLVQKNLPGMWTPGSMVLEIPRHGGPRFRGGHGYPPIPWWLGCALILVFVGTYLSVMLFGVLGGALAPDWRATLLPLGLAVHGTVLHMIASGFNRHRLYLIPFAIVYAGFFLSRRPAELRALATPVRLAAAAVALVAVTGLIASSNYRNVWVLWRYYGA